MTQQDTNFDPLKWERDHLIAVENYVNKIANIYDNMVTDLSVLAASISNIDKDKIFTFDDYPATLSRLNTIINNTSISVVNAINQGVTGEWNSSNVKNDALVAKVLENTKLPADTLSQYANRNLEALAQSRTPIAELSANVFKITKQFTRVAEYGIDLGVAQGTGARVLATSIRKAVGDPDFAFRRVRQENGSLQWSKSFKKFRDENPDSVTAAGQGVYINPQRNYERLTRTEINRSYRKADQTRYNNLDFVVGIRINLSNNPNHCPMCVALAGDYPKIFVWSGWHPSCRCYLTTILKSDAEIQADNIRILQGKEPLKRSKNSVTKMPDNFNQYIKDNADSIKRAIGRGKTPYWVRDGFVDGDFDKGVDLAA